MGLWDGLDKAETFDRGTFMKPGLYTLRVKKCLEKTTRKSGQAFIAEFEVLETSTTEHPVGTSVTWFQKMTDRNVAFAALAEFFAACYQKDISQAAGKADFERNVKPSLPAIADQATGDKNALQGCVVKVEVTMTKTQKNLDFSLHRWKPAVTSQGGA